MDKELETGQLVGPDRGLFAELVFGVLRRQGTLDHILSTLLDQPLPRLKIQTLIILRVGLYQLLYLDRIPESAAVNESVNLAKKLSPRTASLVNAVLRNYLRRRETIIFPDPVTSPAASIAARHSHPEWLVKQWLNQLGEAETELLAMASSERPPLTLRTNTLRITPDGLLAKFTEKGISAVKCAFSPLGLQLEGRHHIQGLPGFRDGLFVVQDEASQVAGALLDAQPGESVLDSCAAPGGKATHLAQMMENRGELLAMDVSPAKLPLITETVERLGITIIRTLAADLLKNAPFGEDRFDRILLDAPCSGLGGIRRNPEAKWRLATGDITRMAGTQKAMLIKAAIMLKPGGTLLYATCSTTLEENEEVVQDFLSHHRGFVLENLGELFPVLSKLCTSNGLFRTWPHRHSMDGFFAARLKKLESL